jgi:hypothetical protein
MQLAPAPTPPQAQQPERASSCVQRWCRIARLVRA